MLEEIKKSHIELANLIPGWKTTNKNDLINAYIDNKDDEDLRNRYFSAIVCRYWNNIYKYYESSKKSVEIETCYEWLVEAIYYILNDMHKWRDPNHKSHNDPNAPDKFVNMSIYSARQYFYQASNTATRAANYKCDSIDRQEEAFGDSAEAINALSTEDEKESPLIGKVKQLFEDNQYLRAFILDAICFQDALIEQRHAEKHLIVNDKGEEVEEKYFRYDYTYADRKVVKSLRDMKNNLELFRRHFMHLYGITDEQFNKGWELLSAIGNDRLYTYIRKFKYELKHDRNLIKAVVC